MQALRGAAVALPRPEGGAAGAAALAWADLRFVARGRISGVHLLDVVAESPFLAGWAAFALARLFRRGARATA